MAKKVGKTKVVKTPATAKQKKKINPGLAAFLAKKGNKKKVTKGK